AATPDGRGGGARVRRRRSRILGHVDVALHGLWRRPPRAASPLRLHGPRLVRARALHRHRRLYGRRHDDARGRASHGADPARGGGGRGRRGRGRGRPLRALRQDLLWDADAGLRYGVLHVPAQVLQAHGRRRRHANAAALSSRQRLGRVLQDRVPDRPLLLLLGSGVGAGYAPHVARRPLPVRPVPQDHPRQPAQGREPRRERAALPLVRLHDLRRLRGRRRSAPRHADGQRGSDARLLDALGQYRLHGAPGRLLVLLRSAPGRVCVHLPPGHGDVGLSVLAADFRRHSGLPRHLRPRRSHGALHPAAAHRGLARVILEALDVRKLYGAYVALDGVSLSIREGEFVSIIGPNGAGKSTLINVLTGVLQPSGGSVRFKGKATGAIGTVALPRLGMARSFQLVQIFPELTVLETLQAAVVSRLGRGSRLIASLVGDHQVQRDALEVAALFGLADKAQVLARALPQGDKKLLDVASAFALRPEIILLDEPTSGVSTTDKHAVMEILVGAAKRMGLRAIIQVEHDMDIVFGYSDRIIALHQGKVLADATPALSEGAPRGVDMVIGRRRH